MFKLQFETDNAAFEDYKEAEIRRILHDVASRIVLGSVSGSIHDTNGNKVGSYEQEQEDDLTGLCERAAAEEVRA